MTFLSKNKTDLGANFADRAGLVGYSDEEIMDAVKASRKAVAAGKVSPATEAYNRFKSRRNLVREKISSVSFQTR